MFSVKSDQEIVLNWRGPLLAAGVFAAVFMTLLLMAHQNQSNTSDMGSSLREDPYGTSLLFDSYGRAGYHVRRSQNEESLSSENALGTTAFFIGGRSLDWRVDRADLPGRNKFRRRVEAFLARGGRVVLIDPAWKLESASQGWEIENNWDETPHESGPLWISPVSGAMPRDTEKMFLSSDSPWLKTDASWTALYSLPVDAKAESPSPVRVYLAKRSVGNGELIAASQASFLLNETIKTGPNPALLDFLAAGRPVVWVDETLHGLHQGEGVLWLVQRYRLQVALLLFWATLLAILWSMSGDLVQRPIGHQGAHILRPGEGAGVAGRRLLQRSIETTLVVTECWEEFRRRSPQDAQAISADPESGPRLRAALAQSPLAGYMQLSKLIEERRATARGLGRTGRSTTSPKKGPEEARFA
jgi:hypothetical protein